MITKDTNIMDIFYKKPIQRRGISTPEKPLPKIRVNPDFEVDPEVSDDMCFFPEGDPCAPFPYRPLIYDEKIEIYSGDGRLMATLHIENFTSHPEMVYTAYVMSKAPEFSKAAQIALRDLGRFHNGIKKKDISERPYKEQSKIFHGAHDEIYSHYPGLRGLYEPVYDDPEEEEEEGEMMYIVCEEDLPEVPESDYEKWFA